ncbi:hypothetical protein NX059_010980 [Plenodomus lindquistii]|nr:hypothetical protein NX059_010980 [Plenodomus lindquistii]
MVMASTSSPAPKMAATATAKASKPKRSMNESKSGQKGGETEVPSKSSKIPPNKPTAPAERPSNTAPKKLNPDPAPSPTSQPRRKPRKLNKDAPSVQTSETTNVPAAAPINFPQNPTAELDALKSRVRGLEAKVEALYDSNTSTSTKPHASRSPRRRGKGRKATSSTQIPTLNTLPEARPSQYQGANDAQAQAEEEAEEEADEELVRLEGELEVARQDLDSYPLRTHADSDNDDDDDDAVVEEIPRRGSASANASARRAQTTMIQGDKQVTLSGSYRIPIPTNVSVEDVKTIKSGVSAAQNVARSFLEQRRARAAAASAETKSSQQQHSASSSSSTKQKATRGSDGEGGVGGSGDKQSWGDWIGGYSLAITRAVKSIEHEAAVESRRGRARSAQDGRIESAPTLKQTTGGKRPPAKATLSSEQVHGLMS